MFDFDFFGSMKPGASCDDEEETVPGVGTARLVIENRCQPLFITIEHTIVASVNGKELNRAPVSNQPYEESNKRTWARNFIRGHKKELRKLGVNVDEAYKDWGGHPQT